MFSDNIAVCKDEGFYWRKKKKKTRGQQKERKIRVQATLRAWAH
jgi:hypothetical protein